MCALGQTYILPPNTNFVLTPMEIGALPIINHDMTRLWRAIRSCGLGNYVGAITKGLKTMLRCHAATRRYHVLEILTEPVVVNEWVRGGTSSHSRCSGHDQSWQAAERQDASRDGQSDMRRLQEDGEGKHAELAVKRAVDGLLEGLMNHGERCFPGILLNPYVKMLVFEIGQGGNVASLSVGKNAGRMSLAALVLDIAHVWRSGSGSRNAQCQDPEQRPVSGYLNSCNVGYRKWSVSTASLSNAAGSDCAVAVVRLAVSTGVPLY